MLGDHNYSRSTACRRWCTRNHLNLYCQVNRKKTSPTPKTKNLCSSHRRGNLSMQKSSSNICQDISIHIFKDMLINIFKEMLIDIFKDMPIDLFNSKTCQSTSSMTYYQHLQIYVKQHLQRHVNQQCKDLLSTFNILTVLKTCLSTL